LHNRRCAATSDTQPRPFIWTPESRAHSFGHFQKHVLLKAHTFTFRLRNAGSEKREVGSFGGIRQSSRHCSFVLILKKLSLLDFFTAHMPQNIMYEEREM
jgi:hypothetical protein